MAKRVLAMFLALALVMGFVPSPVSAAEHDISADVTAAQEAPAQAPTAETQDRENETLTGTAFLSISDDARYVTSDALSELEQRLPGDMFFRCHKSYIVNLNHIDSIAPYGRWTYIVKLRGTNRDALITHERFEALQKLFL